MRQAIAPLIVFSMLMAGCATGHASYVHRDKSGGIIALRGNGRLASKDARRKMSQHCRGPYEVLEENESVVGERKHAIANYGDDFAFGNSHSRQITEMRISYRCVEMPEVSSEALYREQ